MARYFAEIDGSNSVLRVVVAPDLAWCEAHLGGVWVEAASPYGDTSPTAEVEWSSPPVVDDEVDPSAVPVTGYPGPGHGYDPVFPERFAPQWQPPVVDPDTGEWAAYRAGDLVWHEGRCWRSTLDGNVWKPGVSGWHDQPTGGATVGVWVQPTGAHDAYAAGAEVLHDGDLWRSTIDANVWEPGVYGWDLIPRAGSSS